MSSLTPCRQATATKARTTKGRIDHQARLYACAYVRSLASCAAAMMLGDTPFTVIRPSPVIMASRNAGTEELGKPADRAADSICSGSAFEVRPLMMASRTADPKAPPIALALKPRPVAVLRYACGAVNWMSATRRVRGPDCPIPARTFKPICAWFQVGVMQP